MKNIFVEPTPAAKAGFKVVLLRRKELGNNCKFIADAFPGMQICMPDAIPTDATHVIRWGTTSNLPVMGNCTVINTASAIHQTTDKAAFRKLMSDNKLAPRTWFSLADLQKEDEVADVMIVRPHKHERSENVFICKTLAELKAAIAAIKGAYYISEYIPKDRELRVFVIQGRALMVFEKQPKDRTAVSWGCVDEGSLKYVKWSQWPANALETAIKAFNLSKLDFGAVDVIIKGDNAYALEINTAPEVWPYYGECFAKAFQYMIKNGKKRLSVTDYSSWKNTIHPSLSD